MTRRAWHVVAVWLGAAGACSPQSEPAQSPSPVPAQVVSVEAAPPAPLEDATSVHEEPGTDMLVSSWRPGDPVPEAWLRPEWAQGRAPDTFTAVFHTTKGPFTVRIQRQWAPRGVDRFHHLARIGYYTDIAVFRAIDGFMVQFGIHGVPEVNAAWKAARIEDDPHRLSNERGTLVFASAGSDSRTVQLFINTVDNQRLDNFGFTPFGEVIDGMDVVDSLYAGYGEGQPSGDGPSQQKLQKEGNAYVRAEFPDLDYISSVQLDPSIP